MRVRLLTTEQMVEAYRKAAIPKPLEDIPRTIEVPDKVTTTNYVDKYRRNALKWQNRDFIIRRITERMTTDAFFFHAVSEYAMSARTDLLEAR